MDADGIDAAVLYPSQAMFFGPNDPIPALHDIDFVTDCIRAYNDWISEYCSRSARRGCSGRRCAAPGRRARGCRSAAGRHRPAPQSACFIRPSAYQFAADGTDLPLNHHVYDPFWAACQELGVPVAFHPGVHIDTPGACAKFGLVAPSENMTVTNMAMDELHGGSGLGQSVGNAVDMIVTLGRLLMGGVCERFPRSVVPVPRGRRRVDPEHARADGRAGKAFPLERRWLSLLPSEYFKRQCYAGFEPEEWNLGPCAEFLGADRIIWASDYPHPEYHEGIVDELRKHLDGVPEPSKRRILGTNAVDAYHLGL